MGRRSNEQLAKILLDKDSEVLRHESLDRKITLATEGFGNTKFCEIGLRDRNRLSKENALTICEYVIAMKREINPRLSYIKKHNTISNRVIKVCRD